MTDPETTIAILGGTGAQGSALGIRLSRAGYRVILGSRRAAEAADLCAQLGTLAGAGAPPIRCLDNRSAAEAASIVLLTVPFAAQRSTVEEVRDLLVGKILIDATVPLVPPKVARVQLPPEGSAVAAIQRMLGESVRVVSAFQNVSAHLLKDPGQRIECDVLVCGDDVAAREVVIGLARQIGLRAFHAGSIANSAAAEALTSVLIAINSRYKAAGAGIRLTGLAEGDA